MTRYISNQAGNWSNSAVWTPTGVPGNGDSAQVLHAVTVDVDTTIGRSVGIAVAGAGTISTAGAPDTNIVGSGTSFLTTLNPGDIVIAGGTGRGVLTVPTNTSFTTGNYFVLTAGTAYTIRACAVYVLSPGTLTIAAGKKLTIRGDLNMKAGSLTLGAGAQVIYDSSLVAGTPPYRIHLNHGEQDTYASALIANGTSGSRAALTLAASSGPGQVWDTNDGYGGGTVDLLYTDLTIGDPSADSFQTKPKTGMRFKLRNAKITNIGRIWIPLPSLDSDIVITGNEWADVTTNQQEVLRVTQNTGTQTGLRTLTDNVCGHPLKDLRVALDNEGDHWTVQRNVFGVLDVAGSTGHPMALFKHNLWVIRRVGTNASTDWSFVGGGGDSLQDSYVCNDAGPAQATQYEVMMSDTPAVGGTWTFKNMVYERVTPNTSIGVSDVIHCGTPTAGQAFILLVDGLVVLPTSKGKSSGMVRGRGSSDTTYKMVHSTVMNDPPNAGIDLNTGALWMGSEYAGFAGMVAQLQSNLGWSKAVWAGAQLAGFLGAYNRGASTANLLNAAATDHNAHYNASTGTLYDAAGANGTAALGFDAWRQTTKPTLATDVNLGTGSNEQTSGPKFVDPTRNLATFDSAYLGNSAPAWIDGHAYAVGDIVSAQSSTFYGNAVVNFRCVAAHTSSAASATLGQPGSSTTDVATGYPSGYRVTWEFASAYRIRQAIIAGTTYTDVALGLSGANPIQTLHTWVRAGFAPQAATLATAAHDGTTIGAVPYVASTGTYLEFTTAPVGGSIGGTLSVQPKVTVRNFSDGTIVTSSTRTIVLTLNTVSGGPGTITGTTSMACVAGVAQFVNVGVTGTAGVFTLTAT